MTRAASGNLAWVLVLAGGVVGPVRAGEPAPWVRGRWFQPAYYGELAAAVPKPEVAEMVWAIARGSEMGPGDGWFHPGQGRYGWEWLAGRYDANHDGAITRREFTGPAALFDRLDRNHDGVLTREDFDWTDQSALARQAGMAGAWFRLLDANSNGKVSREEWDAFFEKAARGKKYLSLEDLREALQPPPPRQPVAAGPPGPPFPLVLLKGLFSGEIGSFHEGPGVDEPAPDFTLPTQDGKRTIQLSQFQGKKPVVLVFGSFT